MGKIPKFRPSPQRAKFSGVYNLYAIQFYHGGRGRGGCKFILLPVSYLMSLHSSEVNVQISSTYLNLQLNLQLFPVSSGGQGLSANQISSTHLDARLRYNYLRFGKTLNFYFRLQIG